MPKRKRTTASSSNKKQKTTKKLIRSEARKVVLGLSETKSYYRTNFLATPVDTLLGCYNLAYALQQGDDAENYLGKKIWVKDLSVRMSISTNTTNTIQKRARVVVFMSKQQITNLVSNSVTTNFLFRNITVGGDSTNAHVDLAKVDLLYDKVVSLPINTEGGTHTKTFKNLVFKVPFNKTLTYDENNSGIFKDKQLYMGVTAFDGNGTTAPCVFDLYYTINFKDV